MIACILASVFLILIILLIIVIFHSIKKDNSINSIYGLLIMLFMVPFVLFSAMAIDGNLLDDIDEIEYTKLKIAADNWDEISANDKIVIAPEINNWNNHLNRKNNIFRKFVVEDRSQYVIEIEGINKN